MILWSCHVSDTSFRIESVCHSLVCDCHTSKWLVLDYCISFLPS